eukprot:3399593-Rhodomonas_salina.1
MHYVSTAHRRAHAVRWGEHLRHADWAEEREREPAFTEQWDCDRRSDGEHIQESLALKRMLSGPGRAEQKGRRGYLESESVGHPAVGSHPAVYKAHAKQARSDEIDNV